MKFLITFIFSLNFVLSSSVNAQTMSIGEKLAAAYDFDTNGRLDADEASAISNDFSQQIDNSSSRYSSFPRDLNRVFYIWYILTEQTAPYDGLQAYFSVQTNCGTECFTPVAYNRNTIEILAQNLGVRSDQYLHSSYRLDYGCKYSNINILSDELEKLRTQPTPRAAIACARSDFSAGLAMFKQYGFDLNSKVDESSTGGQLTILDYVYFENENNPTHKSLKFLFSEGGLSKEFVNDPDRNKLSTFVVNKNPNLFSIAFSSSQLNHAEALGSLKLEYFKYIFNSEKKTKAMISQVPWTASLKGSSLAGILFSLLNSKEKMLPALSVLKDDSLALNEAFNLDFSRSDDSYDPLKDVKGIVISESYHDYIRGLLFQGRVGCTLSITPIEHALISNNTELVEFLIDNGVKAPKELCYKNFYWNEQVAEYVVSGVENKSDVIEYLKNNKYTASLSEKIISRIKTP